MSYSIKELRYYLFYRLPAIIKGRFLHNLVKVHWGKGLNNFGDCLSPLILKYYDLTPVYVSSDSKADIILAGSILQWLDSDYSGLIIGTGGDDYPYSLSKSTIYAVRGKLTHKNFRTHKDYNNIIYGDPGLLMSYIYPDDVAQKYDLGIIPHFVDWNSDMMNVWRNRFKDNPNVIFISPIGNPADIIEKIKSCRHIVSSSLHGLIVADSYHIPNIRFVDRETMPTYFYDYKFDDYYSSLEMFDVPYLEIKGDEKLIELINSTTLKNVEKIEQVKKQLDTIMIEVASIFKR